MSVYLIHLFNYTNEFILLLLINIWYYLIVTTFIYLGGPDAIKKYLTDPDAMLLIQKLGAAISRATNK